MGYTQEFVKAAFSVENVGDVSAPYISEFGVHIVKYMEDVPQGPIEFSEMLSTTIRNTMVTEKAGSAMQAWRDAAKVEYMGILKTLSEVEADMAKAAEEAQESSEEAPPVEEVPPTQAPAQ